MKEKIIHILKSCMDREIREITEDMELVADLGLSSLDVIDAVLAFENEFGIEISDDMIMELRTVGDIVRCLEKSKNR